MKKTRSIHLNVFYLWCTDFCASGYAAYLLTTFFWISLIFEVKMTQVFQIFKWYRWGKLSSGRWYDYLVHLVFIINASGLDWARYKMIFLGPVFSFIFVSWPVLLLLLDVLKMQTISSFILCIIIAFLFILGLSI